MRPLRVIWNQLICFIFCILAVMGGSWVYREFRKTGPPDTLDELLGLAVGAVFAAFMVYFAVSSWWRARRISRS
jgi:TRAP-type C4-dicarboxylate transport system permease small subunit